MLIYSFFVIFVRTLAACPEFADVSENIFGPSQQLKSVQITVFTFAPY